jgi:hypothetical protein
MSMSKLSHDLGTAEVAYLRALGAGLRHWVLPSVLATALLFGGYEAYHSQQLRGARIRHELARAGAHVSTLAWSTPIDRVEQVVSRQFPGYRVSVEASHFPAYVTVTLHDLDRADCGAAHRMADRIEGQVVIAMEASSEAPCGQHSSITWRIMP